MFTALLSRQLSTGQKRALKASYYELKRRVIHLVASYTPAQLEEKFRALGIVRGDAVLMHSSFSQCNGFRGEPGQVIDCVLNVIGPQGHLFMMSLAYTSSSYDYLKGGEPFDVRKTVSRMGLISEVFRRRQHVLRSSNPLHPVLAWGPKADWIVAGHDQLLYSCGRGSPFEKMLELDTKVLFFDVGFEFFSFTHYLEDRFRESAPLRIYQPNPLETVVIDEQGQKTLVKAYVFDREAIKRRNFSVLKRALIQGGFVIQDRIGNTKLMVVRMTDALKCAIRLVNQGTHFYGDRARSLNTSRVDS